MPCWLMWRGECKVLWGPGATCDRSPPLGTLSPPATTLCPSQPSSAGPSNLTHCGVGGVVHTSHHGTHHQHSHPRLVSVHLGCGVTLPGHATNTAHWRKLVVDWWSQYSWVGSIRQGWQKRGGWWLVVYNPPTTTTTNRVYTNQWGWPGSCWGQ